MAGRRRGLRAGTLGLWHVLAIGLARQSLALPIYFNAGFIERTTGPSSRWYSGWSGQVTPVYLVAGRYIGNLKVLVPLTGMTAVLACFGANALAAGRTLYAVAREGLAPGALAKADPRSRTPWNAQLLVLAVAAVAPIGLGIWQGSYLADFGWTGQVIVFFILIPHLAVNPANPSTTCATGASDPTG
jgi:amino acid transporter